MNTFRAITDLSKSIHKDNVEKGFYEDENDVIMSLEHLDAPNTIESAKRAFNMQRIALIQSEASEAIEGIRKGKHADVGNYKDWIRLSEEHINGDMTAEFKAGFEQFIKDTPEDEIADTIIRCLDYAGKNNIDIGFHIEQKLKYNRTRPYKHGKNS